jgi:hypothetical protein
MFRRHLHPSPIGLALGLILVSLWAAIWIGILAELTRRPEGRTLSMQTANRVHACASRAAGLATATA